MKCGLELMAIAKEVESMRLAKEAKRLEEARAELMARKANTIKWCETVLSAWLEEQVVQGHCYNGVIWSYGNDMRFASLNGGHRTVLQPLVRLDKKYDYANGEHSYAPDGVILDVSTIIEHCAKHCIEVTVTPSNYKLYGCGVQWGAKLSFRFNAQCIE